MCKNRSKCRQPIFILCKKRRNLRHNPLPLNWIRTQHSHIVSGVVWEWWPTTKIIHLLYVFLLQSKKFLQRGTQSPSVGRGAWWSRSCWCERRAWWVLCLGWTLKTDCPSSAREPEEEEKTSNKMLQGTSAVLNDQVSQIFWLNPSRVNWQREKVLLGKKISHNFKQH